MAAANDVDNWLRTSHGIFCKREWIEACIEWINEQGGHFTANMRDSVFTQWLHTDLRVSCDTEGGVVGSYLPSQVFQTQSGEINGRFIVQIDSIADVASSSYGQLQKLKGVESDHDNTSENPSLAAGHKNTRGNRMLFIGLTDGCGLIHAMEYQAINSLSVDTPPGTKLKLEGLIKYRLGVMLLIADHVTVIGGEVEELMVKNSQRNILSRNLNINEEDTAGNSPPTHSADNTLYSTVSQTHPSTGNAPVINPPNNPTHNPLITNPAPTRPPMGIAPIINPTSTINPSFTNPAPTNRPINTALSNPSINIVNPAPSHPPRPMDSAPTINLIDSPNERDIEYIDLLSQSPTATGYENNEEAGLYKSFSDSQHDDLLLDTDWSQFNDFSDDANSITGPTTVCSTSDRTILPVSQVFQSMVGKPSIKVYCKASVGKIDGELSRGASDWSIGAIITDNTGDLPVTIGSKPIEELTGFTLAEYKAKSIPTVQMRQGLLKCHKALVSLVDCTMELQWINGNVTVTKLIDIN